jgi:small subunit ribosomal protein S35
MGNAAVDEYGHRLSNLSTTNIVAEMAKPFEPPTEEQVLRFRYTTYMGEEHPAEKKVVVEFCPADMPGLTPVQVEKLKKLAGVRYNPETEIIKMSCEMFESQAQNKRYLGDLVDAMLQEARVSWFILRRWAKKL